MNFKLKHMKNFIKTTAIFGITSLTIMGCKREAVPPQGEISRETLNKIYNLGFGTKDVQRHEDGYLVEGDIIITEADLNSTPQRMLLRTPNAEQFHTFNLVKSLPRVITVSVSSQLPGSYVTAAKEAINRYNAQGLRFTMQYTTGTASIALVKGNGSYLASAGFPSSGGDPYSQVKINSRAIGNGTSTTFINYVATILSHEIGHCIGFRHTDWEDRSYSCGGSSANEGQEFSGVGAVLVPNTPDGPDAGSFMLACIGNGVNRPFNANDRTALSYLYK